MRDVLMEGVRTFFQTRVHEPDLREPRPKLDVSKSGFVDVRHPNTVSLSERSNPTLPFHMPPAIEAQHEARIQTPHPRNLLIHRHHS